MPGSTSQECRMKERVNNSPKAMERVRTRALRADHFSRSRSVVSNSKSQLCESAEHARSREDIGSLSLGEGSLSSRYIQEAADTVFVGFKRGGIRLTGGFQQRTSRSSLLKRGLCI